MRIKISGAIRFLADALLSLWLLLRGGGPVIRLGNEKKCETSGRVLQRHERAKREKPMSPGDLLSLEGSRTLRRANACSDQAPSAAAHRLGAIRRWRVSNRARLRATGT